MKYAAAFAYRNEVPANTEASNLPGRPEIFAKLRERDLAPVVTAHAESAFTGDGIEAMTLVGSDEQLVTLGHVALDTVGVVVNRFNRSVKKDLLPNPDLLPAMINENETRSLAFRKIRAHKEVLEPLGLDMPTALLESEETLEAFLGENTASKMVVKPNNGSNGKGIITVSRSLVAGLVQKNPDLLGSHVIQPAYNFTHSFPAGVQPYDAASREAFEGWNIAGQAKELRVYGFHSPETTDVFPVARAFQDGDQWFFVDPESLPAELLEGSRQAISRAARATGARALYGTVDYGYGTLDDSAPDWRAVELNARMPYMVGYDKHAEVADTLREMFADQVQATVLAS